VVTFFIFPGKITVNQGLASALLQDDTNEGEPGNVMSAAPKQETEKVYVDWPETDDDEEYRFVSSRVEDYEKKAKAENKGQHQESPQERTYVLKDNLPQSVAPADQNNSPVHVRISSGKAHEDDQTLVEVEANYQRRLQQRIEDNSLTDAQLEIPRLDLEALRESVQDFVTDSLDVISVRSPNPPANDYPPLKSQNFERDSLDFDNEKLADSLEFNPKLNSTFNQEANGYLEYTAIDSSRDPPPRETIVRPPPYGKEETQRNNSNTEMDKYNRAKFNAQHYNYEVKDDNRRPVPQGQGNYDQDRNRWEEVDQGKEVSWAQDQKRATPVPYAGRVEYEARIAVRDDYDQHAPPQRYESYDNDRQPPRPAPDYRYESYEREQAYQEPPGQPRPQYGEDPSVPPRQAPQHYQEPPLQQQQHPHYGDDPRAGPQQRHYDYVDRRVEPQEQYRRDPPSQDQYQQESRPLPEKRAHFQNDNHSQQVAYEQEHRQGQYSQRPPTPYQEEADSHDSEQYKGGPPGNVRVSAQDDLGIYNDESESEPSAVNLRTQNELERDLEELYQNRKGKPRRQLQNDEQYSQLLQERTGGNTDRDRGTEEPVVKKQPQKSPSKPAPDFVETNKQTYGKDPKRTYGKMHEKRKEDASPKRGPKNISNSAGTLSDPEERVEVDRPVKPSSAEEIWSQRAKRLQQKTGGKGKKNSSKQNDRGLMRKFPSESSVPNSGKQNMAHLKPLDEPHVMAPYQVGTAVEARPVQAVWSDDGQRVSLDINLKLVSPAPNNKPPLPPVGQSVESTSNVGSAIQIDRIYDYVSTIKIIENLLISIQRGCYANINKPSGCFDFESRGWS
jgi:hypothetical protein